MRKILFQSMFVFKANIHIKKLILVTLLFVRWFYSYDFQERRYIERQLLCSKLEVR